MPKFETTNLRKNSRKKKQNRNYCNINLSAADFRMLERYCIINKTTPKLAIKKILHNFLADTLPPEETVVENQLDLFAPRQTNIFD